MKFTAKLHRPKTGEDWTFLLLPDEVSSRLPSRGQTTVEGTINGKPLLATLDPDGKGGHWLKLEQKPTGVKAGDLVKLEISPVKNEPEPQVPDDLQKALKAAEPKVRETWEDITPAARRDWIHWIVSPKKAETRVRRVETTVDKLSKGNRRPCCFDKSGKFSKSLSAPLPADD